MARQFYTGIDIGTYHVKVVIAAPSDAQTGGSEFPLTIIGSGTSSSRGLRHGYIIDKKEATKAIREALGRAVVSAKVRVRSARIGLGGIGLDEIRSTGEIPLTPSGGIVTDREIERALREAEKRASSKLTNRSIIHAIPLEYRIDGAKVFGNPQGLQGTRLAIDALLITMLSQHQEDIVEAVEAAGVEVDGVMASPLAASLVTLTKAQKTAGVVLANIGAETLSVAVFENDTPISLKIFPTGSSQITESIALSFKIPLPEAESLKRGGVTGSDVPEKKIYTLVSARLKEMYTLVNAHLKSIDRHRLLPAGVVITGGGSGISSASDIAKAVLQIPSQVSQIGHLPRSAGIDATWAVAFGLCRWGYAEDMSGSSRAFGGILRDAWDSLLQSIRSLLP